ncbi:MAG: serine/threonine protein kinase [Myxococcales bacterium]|nr:serine/threonine protein kinase [Myxococcales bacterium]
MSASQQGEHTQLSGPRSDETQISSTPPTAADSSAPKQMIRRDTSKLKAIRRVQATGQYQKPMGGGTTRKRVDQTGDQLSPETSEQTTSTGLTSEEALEDKILKKLDAHESRERAKVSRDPLIGRVIANRFTITSKIGAGGMGAVYKARQKGMDRHVAIKVLLKEFASNETVVKRFHLEALAVSKLNHPNTISIYDFGQTDDGILYIAMEFLEGMSLENAIRSEHQLAVKRSLHILKQVCLSLTEAHAQGIVHRDLKPDNIFLVKVGNDSSFAKVLDFGVAKLKQADQNQGTLTQAGVIFGTPKYMSPEQSRSLDLDPRSDVYSLGVILYEMLTGMPPFDAENPLAILIQHVQTPPPPFGQVRPDLLIPQEVEMIVRKALSKKANDRQQSCEELIKEIEDVEYLLKNRPEFEIVLTRENIDKIDIRPEHRASLTHPSGLVSLLPVPDGAVGPAFPVMSPGTEPGMYDATGQFAQDNIDTQMFLGQSANTIQGLAVPQVAKSSGVGRILLVSFAVLVLLLGGAVGFFFFKTEKLPKVEDSFYSFDEFSTETNGEIKTSKAIISTTPKGAEVWINGKNTNRFTLEPFVVERLRGAAALTVELRYPKYKPLIKQIAFNEDGRRDYSLNLEPIPEEKPIVPIKPKPVKTDPKVLVTNPKPKPIRRKITAKVKKPKPKPKSKKVIDLKSGYD